MRNYPSDDLPACYGEYADAIASETAADAVIVVVLGGSKGNGGTPLLKIGGPYALPELRQLVVAALRAMADGLEVVPLPGALCAINSAAPKGAAN